MWQTVEGDVSCSQVPNLWQLNSPVSKVTSPVFALRRVFADVMICIVVMPGRPRKGRTENASAQSGNERLCPRRLWHDSSVEQVLAGDAI